MLNRMTKLTLCIALVVTMLFATAAGAGAVDPSYNNGILSIHKGSYPQGGYSGDSLKNVLSKIYSNSYSKYRVREDGATSWTDTSSTTSFEFVDDGKYDVQPWVKVFSYYKYGETPLYHRDITVSFYNILTVKTYVGTELISTATHNFDVDADAKITIESRDGYSVQAEGNNKSFSAAGELDFGKLTGDTLVSITYTEIPDPAVIKASADANEVTILYGETDVIDSSEGISAQGSAVFSITPKSGYYVSSVSVDNNATVSNAIVNGVYTTTLSGLADNTEYTLTVTTESLNLALKNNETSADSPYTVSYNVGATDAFTTFKTDVLALLDGSASVPQIATSAKGNVGIQYKDENSWQNLNAYNLIALYADSVVNGNPFEFRFIYDDTSEGDLYPIANSNSFFVKLTGILKETEIVLDKSLNYTYERVLTPETVKEDILNLFKTNGSIIDKTTGNPIDYEDDQINVVFVPFSWLTTGDIAAGKHEAIISYSGDFKEYKWCSTNVTINVAKAPATITVDSIKKTYDGDKIYPITAKGLAPNEADEINHTSFVAGIGVDPNSTYGAAAFLHINIPDEFGIRALFEEYDADELIEKYGDKIPGLSTILDMLDQYNFIENNWEVTIKMSDLSGSLEKILGALDMTLDSEALTFIKQAIAEINKLPGMDDVAYVKLSFGADIMPKDSGIYLIGGMLNDSNYTAAPDTQPFAMNVSVIKPQTTPQTLAFIEPDENGLYTLDTIAKRNLGSTVASDASLNNKLHNLFVGVGADGKPVFKITDADAKDTAEIRKAGTYTQVAFLLDAGNGVNYATPIIRPIIVVPDLAVVKFMENGKENNERIFTYDGQPHDMTAVVFDRTTGNALAQAEQDRITYLYLGIEGDGEGYASSTPPRKAGIYTVTATYANEAKTVYGAAVGTMIIMPSDVATINVTSTTSTQGKAVAVNSMVHVTAGERPSSEVARTVITAAVNVNGDFSKQGIDALAGIVNVDFPTAVDNYLNPLLERLNTSREQGISADAVRKELLKTINTVNSKLDSDQLTKAAELIADLPANAHLTFKDDVVYQNIGVYVVIGAITDPDYTLKTDVGLLVITPEIVTAELKWDYEDLNGIITRPVLNVEGILEATAYDKGVASEHVTKDKIKYVFLGLNAEGRLTAYTNAKQLPDNGVYFELAYVLDEEVSAKISYVKPIWRVFAVVPQNVDVAVESKTVAYNGEQQPVNVVVTKRDSSAIIDSCLTTVYTGLDTLKGLYNDTAAPINVGGYAVVANYVEHDADAKARGALLDSLADIDLATLKYAGAGVGYLNITPVGEFMVNDIEVEYDGTEKFPVTVVKKGTEYDSTANPSLIVIKEGMEYIALVRNGSGTELNIIFPESWKVKPAEFLNVQTRKAQVLAELETVLPKVVKDSPMYAQLIQLINEKISFNTLRLNGDKPIEVGDYPVIGIAYGANAGVIVDDGVLHIVAPGTLPGGPNDPTVPTDPEIDDALDSLPQTGDNSSMMLWMALLSASAAALVILLKRKANA